MPNYKKLYFELLGSVSDMIDQLAAAIHAAEEAYAQDDGPEYEPHADEE